jgi:hypothetical protein
MANKTFAGLIMLYATVAGTETHCAKSISGRAAGFYRLPSGAGGAAWRATFAIAPPRRAGRARA